MEGARLQWTHAALAAAHEHLTSRRQLVLLPSDVLQGEDDAQWSLTGLMSGLLDRSPSSRAASATAPRRTSPLHGATPALQQAPRPRTTTMQRCGHESRRPSRGRPAATRPRPLRTTRSGVGGGGARGAARARSGIVGARLPPRESTFAPFGPWVEGMGQEDAQ